MKFEFKDLKNNPKWLTLFVDDVETFIVVQGPFSDNTYTMACPKINKMPEKRYLINNNLNYWDALYPSMNSIQAAAIDFYIANEKQINV